MNLALPWLAYCMSILKYECKNEHMIKDIVSRVITIHNSERDPGGHWCLMCSHISSVCVCDSHNTTASLHTVSHPPTQYEQLMQEHTHK